MYKRQTVYHELPNTKGKTLVADISSCFLSEPIDVSKFGILWGGVQKNVGPVSYTHLFPGGPAED